MNYEKDEVLDYIDEEDVKFIRLAFCDVHGNQKNIAIMPSELPRAFEDGISIDASAIDGFGDEQNSDLFLFPDPATIQVLPWRPSHGRVVRMFCDIENPDGTPFAHDTRAILKRAVREAQEQGIAFNFGAEFEFYLFETDESGNPTKKPYDQAGYMDIAPDDKGENVRREICLTLAQMGINPESSHHEEGPGQQEIDFQYSDPLTAADNAVTFKTVVRTIASRNGLFADFGPKPLAGKSGNGMHINISIDGPQEYRDAFIAGMLQHIREITLFLNPTEASYQRLGEKKAPKYISWSEGNRSQLVRIPAAKGKYARIELRSPDPQANPYLAYAMVIYAGLDGILRGLTPPAPADINFYRALADALARFAALPDSLQEARQAVKQSALVKEKLPASLVALFV